MKSCGSSGAQLAEHWVTRLAALGLSLVALTLPGSSGAITLGQTDNFQDGSTDNWNPFGTASNISSGGPAGAGDRYLQVVSGTFGGNSRLITYNQTQWTGDYLSTGVFGVSMSLRNFGTTTLPIRIAIREGTGGSATPGYSSTTPFNLAADGQWHTVTFSLTAGAMTPVNSPQPFATDLANVADFRILSSASPALIGDAVSGRIGIDNITAVSAVPEPGSFALLGFGIAAIAILGQRKVR